MVLLLAMVPLPFYIGFWYIIAYRSFVCNSTKKKGVQFVLLSYVAKLLSSVFCLACNQSIQVQVLGCICQSKDNNMDPYKEVDANA